jgi:hypothetical protein
MLFAILNAGLIYGLIWIFERKRRELHEFDFDKIAVIPPFIYLGLSVLVMVLGLGVWGSWAALIVFLIALFWMLWKNAKVSLGRSLAYSLVILCLNIGLITLLTYKST